MKPLYRAHHEVRAVLLKEFINNNISKNNASISKIAVEITKRLASLELLNLEELDRRADEAANKQNS